MSYKVRLDIDGRMCRRHQDQLRKGYSVDETNSEPPLPSADDFIFPSTVASDNENAKSNNVEQVPQLVRKSTRVRRAPDRLTM